MASLILNTGISARQTDNPPTENETSATLIVNGLDSAGVELISPHDPKFDSAVTRMLAKRTATVALALKPGLVVVSNHSTRAIVAFALLWKVTSQGGRTDTTAVEFKYPDALTAVPESNPIGSSSREGLSIVDGESRVISKDAELGSSWDDDFYLNQLREYAEQQKQEFSMARQVEIELDAVIFSDGLLVGPNHTNLDEAFMAYFESKQKLFRQIVSDLDAGRTVDQAFAPLKTLAAEDPPSPKDPTRFYEIIAAQDINALRRRLGDSDVAETVRNSVRREPFAIRR
jgi:hypothetical protein